MHDGEWNPLRMIRSHWCILTFPSEFTYDPSLIHFWSIYYIQQISTDINGYTRDPRSPFESPTRSSTRSGRPSVACAAAAVARSWGTEKAVVARSAPRDVAQNGSNLAKPWKNHGKTMENIKTHANLRIFNSLEPGIPSFDGLFMFVRFTVKFTGPKIGWFLGRRFPMLMKKDLDTKCFLSKGKEMKFRKCWRWWVGFPAQVKVSVLQVRREHNDILLE